MQVWYSQQSAIFCSYSFVINGIFVHCCSKDKSDVTLYISLLSTKVVVVCLSVLSDYLTLSMALRPEPFAPTEDVNLLKQVTNI